MRLKTVLIIGIDSEIGKSLQKLLLKNGFIVEGTSRKEHPPKGVSFFDLSSPSFKFIDKNYDSVVICAGITNISDCEERSHYCKKINVTNTIKLIDNALKNDSFVIFLSSNSVFDGYKSFYKQTDKTNPLNQYGKFKNLVEKHIKTKENSCVLRLTKVISKNTPLIARWESKLLKGEKIYAFTNRFVSPVDLEDVVISIQTLINSKQTGIFHLGGDKEISYFEFANCYFKNFPNFIKLIKADKDKMINQKSKFNSLTTHMPLKESFHD